MKRIIISASAVILAMFMFAGLAEPGYAEGSAPVAENLELETYRGVSVGGKVSAYDPDGDAVSFEISTEPVKGSIELGEDGSFVYTPRENKRGRDCFGYRATDSESNVSQEATVIIRIEKQKKDVFYSDMIGSADGYAAAVLSERGIFTGEQLGGIYCFSPDKTVSRGEFLSMCMQLSGEPVFSGVVSTGYADDSEIPGWMKGYVATAAMCGIESGHGGEAGQVFDALSPITRAEAAAMLDRALNVTRVSYVPLDSALDADTAQACANLSACGVDASGASGEALSRAAAARMLSSALALLDRR